MKLSFLKKVLLFAVPLAVLVMNTALYTRALETESEIIGDGILFAEPQEDGVGIEDEPAVLEDEEETEPTEPTEPEETKPVRTEEKKDDKNEKVGYILVGDSRFVGMEMSLDMSKYKDVFIVAKSAQGYLWLNKTAVPEVRRIIGKNKNFNRWKVAINLGVNDLGRREKYKKLYKELVKEWDLYFVSVNPVRNYKRIKNESIVSFNSAIRDTEDLKYIDTYNAMMNKGFETPDGVHYSIKTYKDIFGYIMDGLRE